MMRPKMSPRALTTRPPIRRLLPVIPPRKVTVAEVRELEVGFTPGCLLGHERRAERHKSNNYHQYAQD